MSESVKSGRSHTQRYAVVSVDTCEESQNTKQGCVVWAGGVGRKAVSGNRRQEKGREGDVRCGGRGRQMTGRTKLVRVGRLK